jgi:cytochrome c553
MAITSVKHFFARFGRALRAAIAGLLHGGWKLLALRLALIGVVAAILGFTFSWSGLAPVSAHSKHWPITEWFLHFSMRQAVETRSTAIKVPPLDVEAKIVKGAGHYATKCAPCHGAPGVEKNYLVHFMTPEPPFLPPKIKEWNPDELFWIVRNGVKFSAMPAWPSYERKDEVWAMVAFLEQLPEMTPERYQELAYGPLADDDSGANGHGHGGHQRHIGHQHRVPQDALDEVLDNCSRCHGRDGKGRGLGAFPKLAGQKVEYLRESLEAYANGERHSGIMEPVAANLTEPMIDAVSKHYANLSEGHHHRSSSKPKPTGADAQAISRGETIAMNGVQARGVPACRACHGSPGTPQNKIYPRLAGQYPDYLELQLSLFKSEDRGGTPYSHIMSMIAERLTEDEIRDVAAYFGSLEYFGSSEHSQPAE